MFSTLLCCLRIHRRLLLVLVGLCLLPAWVIAQQRFEKRSIIQKIDAATDRLEMIVKSSRILTLEQNIPRAQVNNPEVLELTALSPNQIQIHALRPGVTQVNLWNEEGEVFSVDVAVYGDSRELQMLLKREFPNTAIKMAPVGNSVILSGYVAEAAQVSRIVRMSELFYSSVINNMQVGGVQQVALNVKVMEVSRTKLRQLGIDFAALSSGGDVIAQSVSGMLGAAGAGTAVATGDTLRFTGSSFFAFLDALRQNDLLKVLAEPRITTVSGRPASFNVGGEFPILVPQGFGVVAIEYRSFGTQVDFVPVVLGNGNIKLEVRARISEIDNNRGVQVDDISVPALTVREVNTGVEMKPGQTLALAGLVQVRTEARNAGIPWLSELPWIGPGFRRVHEERNEIELLILVTPELVEPLDPHEVPPGGPGLNTTSPNDVDLFMRGHLEVPHCPPGSFRGSSQPGQGKPQAPAQQKRRASVVNPQNVLDTLPSEEARLPRRRGVIHPTALPPLTPRRAIVPRVEPPVANTSRWPDRLRNRRQAPPTVSTKTLQPPLRQPLRQPQPVVQPVTRPDPYRPSPVLNSPRPRTFGSEGGPGLIGPIGYDILE